MPTTIEAGTNVSMSTFAKGNIFIKKLDGGRTPSQSMPMHSSTTGKTSFMPPAHWVNSRL